MTENHNCEDGHTFGSIVSRGIGNMSLENTETIEGVGTSREDISNLNAGVLNDTAAEGNFR